MKKSLVLVLLLLTMTGISAQQSSIIENQYQPTKIKINRLLFLNT
jgi:hypothetical protein